ncbi:hypothetical protein ARMSODRAFT_8701 [Armillaria solidipes]|uniref:Uncharacterized protein n=1 Tax=Armillaria solidipes TaxID=1076256 RepID=A0A2H3C7B3_9AGAR|nr:hypothetical protein ARMSODRAFT_8701 [Armillaria solidipes]
MATVAIAFRLCTRTRLHQAGHTQDDSGYHLDKVAGMASLQWPMSIPAYYENQFLEDAWSALVNATSEHVRGSLFFLYPEPGNTGTKWRPSWDQLIPPTWRGSSKSRVFRDTQDNNDQCHARCIEKGFVPGLAGRGTPGEDHQHGELLVEDAGGTTYAFKSIANPRYPIPEGTYTFIKDARGSRWVIGRRLPEKSFEKMSLFEIKNTGKLSKLSKRYSLKILV